MVFKDQVDIFLQLLPQLREDLKPLLNGIKSNMENWQKLADENTKLEEENPGM